MGIVKNTTFLATCMNSMESSVDSWVMVEMVGVMSGQAKVGSRNQDIKLVASNILPPFSSAEGVSSYLDHISR